MVNKIEISPETITGTHESGNFFSRQSEEFMAQCPSCGGW
jgi:hypothetical protein